MTREKERQLDDFDAFINQKIDLEHAYNKLRGVKNKPDFSEVYEQLEVFLNPFIEKDYHPKMWSSSKMKWNKV